MYKFMQKNKKRMLAVFGVGLMIVFILPTTMTQTQGHNDTAFHIGDEEVSISEVRQAEQQWQEIERTPGMLTNDNPTVFLARELHDNPEMFVLLQREAKQLGLRVPESQVDESVTMLARQYAMFGQPLPNPGNLKSAMRSLLLVRALLSRVADGVKPSTPLALRMLADNEQRVKVELAHYAVEDFKKDVPAPTPDQLQKQFDEFKNIPPGFPDDRNPFGVGYLVPARVKLHYLTVPREQVAAAVRKSKEQIDWDTLAVLHYRRNQSKYPVTQPAPAPTTTPATTQAAAATTTAPTTRPFAEVKDDVLREVMQPDVDRKVDEVAAAVHERLLADFESKRKGSGAVEDFGTRQYFDRIVADIEKRFGVRLGVSEINEPKDQAGLRGIKGIGQSFSGDTTFADYVLQWAEPLVPMTQRTRSEVLSLDEPSPRFRDLDGNVYVFQIREATAAAPPASLDVAKAKVEEDVRTKLAFDAAVAAAKKLRDEAAKGRLAAAAKAAGKDVFPSSDFFSRQGMSSSFEPVNLIPGVELTEPVRQKLIADTMKLLGEASPEKPHPAGVIELPAAGRVVVAELADVERPWRDDQQDIVQYQISQQLAMQRAQQLLTDYFKFDAIKARLNYRSMHG